LVRIDFDYISSVLPDNNVIELPVVATKIGCDLSHARTTQLCGDLTI